MHRTSRRDFLRTTAGAIASVAAGQQLMTGEAAAQSLRFKPEAGATLRVLRWKRFVQGDEDQWLANSRKFSETTGVPVTVESENWEDLRPKAAVAANVGSGPDIIIGTNDDAHLYPDKLADVSDVADGGLCPRRYGRSGRHRLGFGARRDADGRASRQTLLRLARDRHA